MYYKRLIIRVRFVLLVVIGCVPTFAFSQCPPPNGVTSYKISCPGSLAVQAISTGSNANVVHRWYNSPTESMYFFNSAGVFNGYTTTTTYTTNITTTTNFYVEAYNPATNCISQRIMITVTVGPWIATSGDVSSVCTSSPNLLLSTSPGCCYQWSIFGAPIPGATSQTYSPATAGVYAVTVGGMSCGEKTSSVYILPTGKIAVATTGATSNCGAATMELTASSQPMSGSVTAHKWYTSATGSETVTSEVVATGSPYRSRVVGNFNATTTYYVSAVSSSCGEGPRYPVTATINPPPVIYRPTISFSGDPDFAFAGDKFTSSASGFSSYQWYVNGSAINGATNKSYAPTSSGQYTIQGTYLCGTLTSDPIKISYVNETQSKLNYTSTYISQMEGIDDADVFRLKSPQIVQQQTVYSDGLGFAQQEVTRQASPHGYDIVKLQSYDPYGRVTKSYLPYSDGRSGFYKTDANSKQYQFYNNQSDNLANDTRPYSEISYENSPLNRPTLGYEPGQDWYDKGRSTAYSYQVNVHGTASGQEQVIAWQVNDAGILTRKVALGNYIEPGGYYSTGQLQIRVTTDEDGNIVREYVDKLGRTLLKKVQAMVITSDLNNDDQWACTYYIYNDYGKLIVVLPPEASRAAKAGVN